ncbi:MAG: beta-lactamase family protein [Gammaproteobacteria bacterium]|nr:beta-lactamase family protein [Gammaproteobacteria bacterium]
MTLFLSLFTVIVVMTIAGLLYTQYRLNNTQDKGDLEVSLDAEISKLSKQNLSYDVVIGVYKEGKSLVKGYEIGETHKTPAPDASSIFQLGSISKLFTAALLQILADEEVVDKDATLEVLIGSTIALSAQAKQVTLRQLATHTSGFPRVPKVLMTKLIKQVGKKHLMIDPYSYLSTEDIFAYLAETQGIGKPGKFAYSNYGMGLLGHVLEIITHKDLGLLAAEKIFKPLGMRNTSISLTPDMQQRLVQGYTAKGKATPLWTFSALGGAGAFSSTASDMMAFLRANIEDSSPLFQSFKKMHHAQTNGYTGIGWIQAGIIDKFLGNQSIVWHNGMVGGYASYLCVDIKNKSGVVILSSIAIDPAMMGKMIVHLVRTQSWR